MPRSGPERMNTCRILVVEDHADSAAMLSLLLRRQGWQVTVVDTVARALNAAGNSSFDVMLCDLGLPDGDGCDLLRQVLARSEGTQRVKAVAVTGHAYESDAQRARNAGFLRHITKPYDAASIIALVKSLC